MIEHFTGVQHRFRKRRKLGTVHARIHTAISHAAIW